VREREHARALEKKSERERGGVGGCAGGGREREI